MALLASDVAQLLGTTVPRVHRAVRDGKVPHNVDSRGHPRFTAEVVDLLRRTWGYAPTIEDLSREQVFVLAALSRRPLGLCSARAVARAAGVSPTTAGRALKALTDAGYVERRTQRVAEGRARDVDVWAVRWGSEQWRRIAADLGRCVLPTPRPAQRQRGLPRRLGHLFWNVDLGQLDVVWDGRLIAGRVLRSDDVQALAWLAANIDPADIEAASQERGLDPKRANLGRILSASRR